MVRGFYSFGSIMLTVGVALLIGLQKSGKVDVLGLLISPPEVDEAFQQDFRSQAIMRINQIRVPAEVGEIHGDELLQDYLEEFVSRHPKPQDIELDEVFDSLQTKFPGAQYLAANLITSANREDLLEKLSSWTAVANPDFDSIITTVFRAVSQIGVIGVMSRRIPEFSLRAANTEGGRFHNRCPHCQVIHALELDRDSRTLILSCPHCDLPFDVLAVGSSGEIKRATDFLEGFRLFEETTGKRPASGEERVLALWSQVADHCEYQLDQDRAGASSDDRFREVWKASGETWHEASGDCEDTSILLADVLISAGFEARVAIGWNGNIGQHAWVVVKVGTRQYILESTLQKKIENSDLVDVESSAAFYQPEQLIDRDRIYYSTARPDRFRLDYFSTALWKAIPKPEPSAAELSLR